MLARHFFPLLFCPPAYTFLILPLRPPRASVQLDYLSSTLWNSGATNIVGPALQLSIMYQVDGGLYETCTYMRKCDAKLLVSGPV